MLYYVQGIQERNMLHHLILHHTDSPTHAKYVIMSQHFHIGALPPRELVSRGFCFGKSDFDKLNSSLKDRTGFHSQNQPVTHKK